MIVRVGKVKHLEKTQRKFRELSNTTWRILILLAVNEYFSLATRKKRGHM